MSNLAETVLSKYKDDPTVDFTATVLAVRHGDKQKIADNDAALLTERGRAQVNATGCMLSERYGRTIPVLALSSNLIRAKETIQIVANKMGYQNYEVQASAGFGYQWLMQTCPQEEPMVEAIAGKPEYASASAAMMAELLPQTSAMAHALLTGALAVALNRFNNPGDLSPLELPDGSLLVLLGNHSPVMEFLPHREDWSKITKRAPASGIIIPVVVYKNGRVEVIPGAECFDAGPLES